jgi:hypothetical protein
MMRAQRHEGEVRQCWQSERHAREPLTVRALLVGRIIGPLYPARPRMAAAFAAISSTPMCELDMARSPSLSGNLIWRRQRLRGEMRLTCLEMAALSLATKVWLILVCYFG